MDELSSKGYTKRENNVWKLSSKGSCVALTLFDFNEIRRLADFDELQSQFRDMIRKVKRHPVIAIMTAPHQDNTLKDQYDRMEKEERFVEDFITKLRDFTSELVRAGLDLDTLSNEDFEIIIANKVSSWMKKNTTDT